MVMSLNLHMCGLFALHRQCGSVYITSMLTRAPCHLTALPTSTAGTWLPEATAPSHLVLTPCPSQGSVTMLSVSFMTLNFSKRSVWLVVVREGLAFT
jgi:hypothetical protein